MSSQRFGNSKFSSKVESNFDRQRNTREEKAVKEDLPKITFSFKDFDVKQIPPGQTYDEWETGKLLSSFLKKIEHICKMTIVEAMQQGVIKLYGSFPVSSHFKHSQHIVEDVRWAVITDIKGQKCRVAGHIIGSVFYVVFLDKDHKFYPSSKKNT